MAQIQIKQQQKIIKTTERSIFVSLGQIITLNKITSTSVKVSLVYFSKYQHQLNPPLVPQPWDTWDCRSE
jgi:hypothetical protein